MKFTTLFGTAAALLSAHSAAASDAHRRMHSHNNLVALEKKHAHGHLQVRETEEAQPAKRGGQCAFPTDDDNLVAVTPGSKNAGWAMPPDQACEPDSYCPIACKPGMVMAQWKPDTKYQYPESMYGGLYCDKNGNIKKPFPNKPNCVPGTGAVKAVNKCGKKMSFCQTVLPGMEDMIIPTLVSDSATLAVPGPSYWGSTAAHFYVNPPGTEEKDCIWGDESNPIGNWSPYVAGTNTDDAGLSYVKLGLNPIWLDSPLKSTKPDFGLKIECDGDCPGLPCSIDISGSNPTIKGLTADTGAGGANFCVVTVPKGQTARIVAYSADGGSGGSDESESPKEEKPKPSPKPEPKPKPKPSPKPEPKPEPVATTSEEPEPTTTTPPPPPPSTTPEESTTAPETTEEPTTTSEKPSTSTSSMKRPSYKPGVFRENGTDPTPTEVYESTSISKSKPTDTSDGPTDTGSEEPETKDEDNEAGRKGGSAPLAGLVVAFVAAACFF